MHFPLVLVNIPVLRVTEHGGERATRETKRTKEVQESSVSGGKRRELEHTKQVQGGDSGGDMQGEQSLAGEEENKPTQRSDTVRVRIFAGY